MHMHAKYQVSICNGSKVMAMLKLSSNKQTNVTNRQTNKQTGQKQYAPQILSGGGGIKKGMSIQATSIAEKFFHFALCKSILPFR